jgi:hypothetical protein
MYCTLRLDGAPQVVPVQTFGDAQSVLVEHDVLQVVVPQT